MRDKKNLFKPLETSTHYTYVNVWGTKTASMFCDNLDDT